MPGQLTLFDVPAKPRRPPRVLMCVADAGYVDGVGDAVRWLCVFCGYKTCWQPAPPPPLPCPRCNVEALKDE